MSSPAIFVEVSVNHTKLRVVDSVKKLISVRLSDTTRYFSVPWILLSSWLNNKMSPITWIEVATMQKIKGIKKYADNMFME